MKPVSDNRFEWTVKLSNEKESNVICSVSGRKTNPTAEIEGESPLTYQVCFINFGAIKNTAQGGALYTLQLKKLNNKQMKKDNCNYPFFILLM